MELPDMLQEVKQSIAIVSRISKSLRNKGPKIASKTNTYFHLAKYVIRGPSGHQPPATVFCMLWKSASHFGSALDGLVIL